MRRSSATRGRALIAGLLATALLSLTPSAATAAPDPLDAGWESGWGRPGPDGPVAAVVEYQGDLIAGGDFLVAGGGATAHVARWDGTRWRALGDGVPGAVRSLVVFGDRLVAGCAAGTPGGSVFAWDGAAWTALGPGFYGEVAALAVYRGELIAGGSFTQLRDGRVVDEVVRWDGAAWRTLGSGVGGWVRALVAYGDTLVAGGSFGGSISPGESIARWDGATWSRMGDLLGDAGLTAVTALTVHGGQLIAGGGYFRRAAVDTFTTLDNLARWDGARWRPIGGGTPGPVAALASVGGALYVGGAFDRLDSASVARLARWDGVAWSAVGDGVDSAVRALAPWGTRLAIGGDFTATPTGRPLDGAAVWDGATLAPLSDLTSATGGLDLTVRDLLVTGTGLVVAGDFARAANASGWLAATGVAARAGATWDSLGAGLRTGRLPGSVRTVATYGGTLFAGGTFDSSGAAPAGFMARWDGVAWRDLGPGLNGTVEELTPYRTGLYAVGSFVNIGNSGTDHIGRYEGGAWHAVNAGFGSTAQPRVMAAWSGQLIVGGLFTGSGLASGATNIASWDGLVWRPVGDGLNGIVYALLGDGGVLFAGGLFTASGATPLHAVANWDGYAWRAMGSEFAEVTALALYRGELVAAGSGIDPDGHPFRGVARWDGAHWRPMGSSMPDGVVARMVEWDGRLWAVGSFRVMGAKAASGIATWRDEALPGGWPYSHPPLALATPMPNPSVGPVTLRFDLPAPGAVTLTLHDVQGRRVATLVRGEQIGGPHTVRWDARLDDGRAAPAGVYFARLESAAGTRVTRVVLLR